MTAARIPKLRKSRLAGGRRLVDPAGRPDLGEAFIDLSVVFAARNVIPGASCAGDSSDEDRGGQSMSP